MEGRNAEYYVPPLFFEKDGDKKGFPKKKKIQDWKKIV